MGIFLINIQSFLLLAGQEELTMPKFAKWGYQIIDMLALGKFHFIFAFLFGVGASIFLTRLSQKKLSKWVYIRRMTILGIIAIGHITLWGGDVLLSYAFCGFILLFCNKLPLKWIVVIGVFLSFFYDFYIVFSKATNIDFLPSFLDILGIFKTLGHMMLGFIAFQIGLFQQEKWIPTIRKACTLLFVGTVAIWTWSLLIQDENLLHAVTFNISVIPGMLYIGLMILICHTNFGAKYFSIFRSYGKMALTNYLCQTIIGITLIPVLVNLHFLSVIEVLLVCFFVYVIQILLSNIWFKFFHFGPIEWLWRSGTYMSIQPFKK